MDATSPAVMIVSTSRVSSLRVHLRRLPEKEVPECAGCSFAFQARQLAPSKLGNGWRNAEGGRTDQQAGISFDKNRLNLRASLAAVGGR